MAPHLWNYNTPIYGPRIGAITMEMRADDPGSNKIVEDATGLEVVFVSRIWLDGVLAPGGLHEKYNREVEAHRDNCKALKDMTDRALQAEATLATISAHFMHLHNIAKTIVGPKEPKV